MSNITKRLNKVLKTLDDRNIAQRAITIFKEVTPENTGNARRSTKLSSNTIEANYPYAQVLNEGRRNTSRGMRGSKQAPRGMTEPTIQRLRDYVENELGVSMQEGQIKWQQ